MYIIGELFDLLRAEVVFDGFPRRKSCLGLDLLHPSGRENIGVRCLAFLKLRTVIQPYSSLPGCSSSHASAESVEVLLAPVYVRHERMKARFGRRMPMFNGETMLSTPTC